MLLKTSRVSFHYNLSHHFDRCQVSLHKEGLSCLQLKIDVKPFLSSKNKAIFFVSSKSVGKERENAQRGSKNARNKCCLYMETGTNRLLAVAATGCCTWQQSTGRISHAFHMVHLAHVAGLAGCQTSSHCVIVMNEVRPRYFSHCCTHIRALAEKPETSKVCTP